VISGVVAYGAAQAASNEENAMIGTMRMSAMVVIAGVASAAWAANPLDLSPPETAAPSPNPNRVSDEQAPGDFGPTGFYSSAVDAFALIPYNSSGLYDRGGATGAYYCRVGTTDTRAVGQLHMPHGVRISSTRIWGYDDQATAGVSVTYQASCLPDFAPGAPINTTFGTAASGVAFSGGDFSNFDNPAVQTLVDNQSCNYRVIVDLGVSGGCTAGTSLGLYKARVNWARFIPPAPAVASFTDVPTTDGSFAVIEALRASGITQGCTATEYCPTQVVTRAQMAAFLARALGLPPQTLVDPANP
jgi:hypothetical protein